MTKATLVNQPEKYWDRLFAPGGHCGIVTTVDTEGRVNAASLSATSSKRCAWSAYRSTAASTNWKRPG